MPMPMAIRRFLGEDSFELTPAKNSTEAKRTIVMT